MSKQKTQIEFRYYNIPEGDYVLAKLGPGWEQEYGLGLNRMLHFHNYFEIGYCYHGKGELIIEDRVYNYSDDCFSLIPQNVPHGTVSAPGNICKWEFLFVDIEAFIRDVFRGTSLSCDDIIRIVNKRGTMKTKKNHAAMAKLIRNIIEESRRKDLYYRQSIIGYLYALVVEIMRLDEEREMAKHVDRINNYIKSAIDYIGKNYADEIKIQELADVCGLSESHFRRIFVESMGMPPFRAVSDARKAWYSLFASFLEVLCQNFAMKSLKIRKFFRRTVWASIILLTETARFFALCRKAVLHGTPGGAVIKMKNTPTI